MHLWIPRQYCTCGKPPDSGLCHIINGMKRKPQTAVEPVISAEIIEGAKRSIETDRIKPVVACTVCGSEATVTADEQLCWVCRRLKISAWRDVESQMPAQE